MLAASVVALSARQDAGAATLLAEAREALGGDALLAAITTFTVTGSFNRLGKAEGTFDYSCALPDRFLRESRQSFARGPIGSSLVTRYEGFNGDEPIMSTVAPDMPAPPIATPPPTTPAEIAAARLRQVHANKRIFVELVLPLVATSFAGYPLTFSSAGQIPTPHGPADVVEVTGPDADVWRLWLDAKTHLPVVMTWMAKPIVTIGVTSTIAVNGRGQVVSPPAGAPVVPGDPTAGLANVEWRLEISDYRAADGLHWPHRFTSSYPGMTWEDVRLNTFKINVTIDPKTFTPTKTPR
jgi:hypothetical protein